MRIQILGDNETARAAAAYLRRAGLAVVDRRADVVIDIEEHAHAASISLDSLNGDVHHALLRSIWNRRAAVRIAAPGKDRDDRRVKITLPAKDAARQAVEGGVLDGVLAWLGHKPKRNLWKRIFSR